MAVRQRAVAALPMLMRHAPPRYHAEMPSLRRAFSLYDQINIIDNVPEDQLRFQQCDETGFKINGVKYEGSLRTLCREFDNVLDSEKILRYHSRKVNLSIFKTLRPIPEIMVLGCGRYIEPVKPEIRTFVLG